MNDLTPNKFSTYRARKKAAGLREVRMWVPDFDSAAFQLALDAQIERINASEDEREVMIFCETATAEIWEGLD